MRMYGFAHDKTGICKRSAVMHAVESSTATIRVGAKCRDEGAAVGERLPLPYDIVSMIACNTLRTSQRRRPGVARAFRFWSRENDVELPCCVISRSRRIRLSR